MSEWHKAVQAQRQALIAALQDAVRNSEDADRIVTLATELNALNSAYGARKFAEEPVDHQGHFEENKAERYEKNFATVLGQRRHLRAIEMQAGVKPGMQAGVKPGMQAGAGGINVNVKADNVSLIHKLMEEVKSLAMNSGTLPSNADATSFFNAMNTAELWAVKLATR